LQREKEFLAAIRSFQELTINSKFEKQALIKAKSLLLQTRFESIPPLPVKFQPIVKLTDNLIAFIELFENLL
jgi:hypothetical protein